MKPRYNARAEEHIDHKHALEHGWKYRLLIRLFGHHFRRFAMALLAHAQERGLVQTGEWHEMAAMVDRMIRPKRTLVLVSESHDEAKWRCRRCGTDVDMEAFRCQCTTSPSPWEPISQRPIAR